MTTKEIVTKLESIEGSLDKIDKVYIPEINLPLNQVKTITYKNMYLNSGYIILYVNTDNKSCVIKNYDRKTCKLIKKHSISSFSKDYKLSINLY